MPLVDLRLQGVARGQKLAVLRREILDDAGKPRPEGVGGNAGPGRRFLGDKIIKGRCDLQSAGFNSAHDFSLLTSTTEKGVR